MTKIIFVGFKCDKDKSVFYQKVKTTEGKMFLSNETIKKLHFLARPLLRAYRRNCDFVSIRFVKKDK